MPRLRRIAAVVALLAVAVAARAAVYEVGGGASYPSLAALPALAPGDEVRVHAGTYAESHRFTASGTSAAPIRVHGVDAARPLFDASGLALDGTLPHPRAALQIEGDWVVLEHLEARGAHNGTRNGAGVRATSADNATVRDCVLSGCDMGLTADGCANLLVDGCEITGNGVDAATHNVYINSGVSATIRGSWIHAPTAGQNVKARCHFLLLVANRIEASVQGEVGIVDGPDTAAADANAVLVGNEIISVPRPAGANKVKFIEFGADVGGARAGTLYAFANTCIAGTPDIVWFTDVGGGALPLVASGNLLVGSGHVLAGAWSSATGAGNCVATGAAVPTGWTATTTAADPLFVDRAGGDIRLAAGSPARDAGATSASYRDGGGIVRDGLAAEEYARQCRTIPRANDGHPDAGAHETGTAGGGPTDGTTQATAPAVAARGGHRGCGRGGLAALGAASLALALRRRPTA